MIRERLYVRRGGEAVTVIGPGGLGFTLWRRGAVSLLACGDVLVQLVVGDWWQAHPNSHPCMGGLGVGWRPFRRRRP